MMALTDELWALATRKDETVSMGNITDPGKFEGAPAITPHLYAAGLDGAYDGDTVDDETGHPVYYFDFRQDRAENIAEFLREHSTIGRAFAMSYARAIRGHEVIVWEDEQGFVGATIS